MNVLCLVELDDAGGTDASLRALTFARSLVTGPPGEPGAVTPDGASPVLAGVAFGPADWIPARLLGSYGVTEVYVVEPATLDGYAPQAWARTLEGLLSVTMAGAVVAAGTDCGSEVLAHLGALTGQPMAANCIAAAPAADGTLEVSRQRWAGLLIEDAILEGTPALLTVATDAVAPQPAVAVPGAEAAEPPVQVHEPDLDTADLRVQAALSASRDGGVSLASARGAVGGGRGGGGPRGFAPPGEAAAVAAPRWRNWPACSAGWSGCPAWSPARAGGRTPSRSARPAPRSPPSSTWPAGSAGRSSTWLAAPARSTSWWSTPTPRRQSCPGPTTR